MRALVFDRQGIDNLSVRSVPDPNPGRGEVLLKIMRAGVNPVDYLTVTSLKVPLPHIPGTEFAGVVQEVGPDVTGIKPGERVALYTRFFDGKCDMCLKGKQMLCRNGGRIGVDVNGGFAEFIVVKDTTVFPFTGEWELAASLSAAALTAYHALKEANVGMGKVVAVLGASGNTGMFAIQLAKKMGAKTVAVSRKRWLKEMGADVVTGYEEAEREVRELTHGRMADVVINSLGASFWEIGTSLLGLDSTLVTFGVMTGNQVRLDLSKLYSKHIRIIGTNRGSLEDFRELIEVCSDCRVRVWKEFSLEEGKDALIELSSSERNGRIFIDPTK